MSAVVRPSTSTTTSQRPERSGLPSAVRGAGAARFALPSGVRGMAGVLYCAHCAGSGVISAANMNVVLKIFIGTNTSSSYYTPTESRTPEAFADHRAYAPREAVTLKRRNPYRSEVSSVG